MADSTSPGSGDRRQDMGAQSAARVTVEVERKFEVPPAWEVPELTGVGRVSRTEGPTVVEQEATYLDTPWLDLLAAKRTLRRRTGGSDAGWHLKSPASGEGRTETVAPLGSSAARVPTELREAVSAVTGTAPVVPVCLLRTRRSRRTAFGTDESGQEIVFAVLEDDSVEARVLIGQERVKRWREVEVELVDGSAEDLDNITEALLGSGAELSPSPSKVGRALAGEGRDRDEGTAGAQVMAYVAAQVGVIQSYEPRVRRDEPDAVHKSRVATRRLRSTLRTYRKLFDRSVTDPLRDELRWAAALLGGPRDGEVMLERIGKSVAGLEAGLVRGGAGRRLLAALESQHTEAFDMMLEGLDSPRYTGLLESLTELVMAPPLRERAGRAAQTELPRLVGESARRVVERAEKASTIEDRAERHDAVHEVRKLAKAARYAAEAAGDSAGDVVGGVVSAWTEVQEALGDHQDSVVARQVLEAVYRDALEAGEDTFTYGVLIGGEAGFARGIEKRMDKLIAAARKASADLT